MMPSSEIVSSTNDLILELSWLEKLINMRISSDKRIGNDNSSGKPDLRNISAPDLSNSNSPFALFIKNSELTAEERVLLALAIAPHLKPEFLEIYINNSAGMQFYKTAEFLIPLLGTRGSTFKGLLPTGLTYLYILAGTDLKERIRLQNLLSTMTKPLFQQAVIIQPHNLGEPVFSGRIVLVEEYLELFTIDQADKYTSTKYAFNNLK